jgi:DNA-binding LacI/PurR family transcriptional regulator
MEDKHVKSPIFIWGFCSYIHKKIAIITVPMGDESIGIVRLNGYMSALHNNEI